MAAWQFAGSVAVVAALIWLAFRFGFRGEPQLLHRGEALVIAGEVVGGFDAVQCALDERRAAALLRDSAGRIVLVAPCGANFLARLLTSSTLVARAGDLLSVRDGALVATLELGEAAIDWERAIARL